MERYVTITDNETGRIIASGAVYSGKREKKGEPLRLISFDGKYYYNEDSTRYTVTDSPVVVRFTQFIPDNYKVLLWSQYEKGREYDIIREYGEDELDPEVKSIVTALNKLPGIVTVSSCCGHGRNEPHISFKVERYKGICGLSCLLHILSKGDFQGNFILSTLNAYNDIGNISLSLGTRSVGNPAYALCNELAQKIESFIKEHDVPAMERAFKKDMMEYTYHV